MATEFTQFLPYGRQLIDDDDVAAVERVLRSDWLTTGPAVDEFERVLAEKVGTKDAVACANATAGLHLAVLCLQLEAGDLVVVPSVTFLATANVVRHVGAEVIFADVDPSTGLMGPEQLEEVISRANAGPLKAVIPVHLGGQCADPPAIAEICASQSLHILEDAAHSLGTLYQTKEELCKVGACRHSDMSVFSFHPVKTATMGEGGAVMTNNQHQAARLRRYRNHGITRAPEEFVQQNFAQNPASHTNPWYYEMVSPGFNYRASDIHCVLGLSQLSKLDEFVARRRFLADRYDQLLAPLSPVLAPLRRVDDCQPAWHIYVVRIDFSAIGLDRAAFMARLRDQGVGSQVHYIPLHLQPYYQRRYGKIHLSGAEKYYESALSLPLFPAMDEADVDRVAATISEIVEVGLRAGA